MPLSPSPNSLSPPPIPPTPSLYTSITLFFSPNPLILYSLPLYLYPLPYSSIPLVLYSSLPPMPLILSSFYSYILLCSSLSPSPLILSSFYSYLLLCSSLPLSRLSGYTDLDWSRGISCFQLSNNIMQNNITLEGTLKHWEAGQVLFLRTGKGTGGFNENIIQNNYSQPCFIYLYVSSVERFRERRTCGLNNGWIKG